ncbi:MAG TPA: DUF1592 domain-containing protein [Vicinamibacterales bacterium]|nr:DUF1592 domain-containing protein [Vicinamibacterales bacterium]
MLRSSDTRAPFVVQSFVAALVCLGGIACTGRITAPGTLAPGGAGGSAGNGPGPSGTGAVQSSSCAGQITPGRAPLRRLNQFEYNNTIRDLLGETTRYADGFPPDEQGGGFSNNADALVVSHLLAESYASAAQAMAATAVTRLSALNPCDVTTTGEDSCARQFIVTFGKRAFRRPITSDETTRFLALYSTGRMGGTYADGISVVIEMMLQSPHFIYRVEPAPALAAGAAPVPVTPYELATRLSYFIWGSMPDDTLFAAADAGALSTPTQVGDQARRMLQDNRAHDAVAAFHREWLQLDHALVVPKAAMMFPTWSPTLAGSLFAESQAFVENVFWSDGHLATLLSAPYTFADQAVAQYYGATAPASTSFAKLMLDPTQRAGLLTQGTFLAANAGPDQTSPVQRGKFVREQLLCQTVAPPPNNLVIMPPKVDQTSSTRDRFKQHEMTGSSCAACHALMDPLGFGFEHYDPIGQWRTVDGPSTVDASGMVTGTDVDGPYDGAVALMTKLSASQQVANCVATQWFRFATGRTETAADMCTLQTIQKQLSSSQADMRTLPVAIATSDAFRYRTSP